MVVRETVSGKGDAGISGEFALAGIHERAVSHARNEPTLANFRPTSAGRNFKRRAVSTARHRLSDHRFAIPASARSRRQVSAMRERERERVRREETAET